MVRSFLVALACAGFATDAYAAGCSESDAPDVTSASSWKAYKSWCSACKGTVSEIYETAVKEGGCKLPSANAASTAPAAAGHQMDEHIATAISAGVTGQISVGDAAAIAGIGILGNMLLAPSTRNPSQAAAQAAALAAQAAERERALEAEKSARAARLQSEMIDTGESARTNEGGLLAQMMTDAPPSAGDEQSFMGPNGRPRLQRNQPRAVQTSQGPYSPPHSLAGDLMKDPDPPARKPTPAATPPTSPPADPKSPFGRGFDHGSNCYARRGGVVCSGVTAEETPPCLAEYENGYAEGYRSVRLRLDTAYANGEADGPGQVRQPQADATGECRNEILHAYDAGYRGNPRP